MPVRIGINGFGRIGRITFRAIAERHWDEIEIVAVNDLAPADMNAHLLRYDTNYGRFDRKVELSESTLHVDGRKTEVFAFRNPVEIPWNSVGAQIVIESTGVDKIKDHADVHMEQSDSVKKVIVTAPAKNVDMTVVMGVNEDKYDAKAHRILSNASCTTNCLAPIARALSDSFGIVNGLMTTVHSYTNDQRINDVVHPDDARRARAAAMNMIPTSTGAARAISEVIPELKGKMHGVAIRVPTSTVSLVDLVVNTERPVESPQAVNDMFRRIASERMREVLRVCDDPCVSSDFRGDSSSSIVDAQSTMTMGDRLVKVLSWYDNEWAYSCRVGDLAAFLADKEL